MEPALLELTRLAPPATSPLPQSYKYDWNSVATDLATPVADSYKQLIEAYGCGCFDGFIWVYSPRNANKYMDLVSSVLRDRQSLLQCADAAHLTAKGTSPEALASWGITDNGDVLTWDSAALHSKVVTYSARGPYSFAYDGSVCEFLLDVLGRKVNVPHFPNDWPSDRHHFMPLTTM
jgi:hypothetical protein